ncbi:LuxR C-terminal-related transcriptional regulator [Streptomyces chartreusis]|uniref:LuxR C-terminal-related transcriptional regulator n=1 Tax=Streptomyces chartreusis TaxID=1969 RepID=UPI00362EF730
MSVELVRVTSAAVVEIHPGGKWPTHCDQPRLSAHTVDMAPVRPEIVDALARLKQGKPSALLAEVDPSTRTASVMNELRSAAQSMGFSTVVVSSVESDQFSTQSRLLESLTGCEVTGSDGRAVTDQVAELLDAISQQSPVVVVIEDAHWSDPGTLLALRTLPELLRHLPILWAVGVDSRTSRADRVVAALQRIGPIRVTAEATDTGGLVRNPISLLQVGSVIGIEFDLDVAARVLGRSAGSLLNEVDNALATGALVDSGSKLRFADAQFRNSLYAALPSSVRKALHYEVAKEMALPGAESEVVWHLAHSTGRLAEDDLAVVRSAISRLGTVAPEDAAVLAFQVSDLFPPSDAHHVEFITTAARHLGDTSRVGEALSILEHLNVRGLSHREEARLRLVTAHLHQAVGDDTEAMSHVNRALALPGIGAELELALLKTKAVGHVNLGEIEAATQVSRPLLRSARHSPDPATKASADLFASQLAFCRARVKTALALARQAVSSVEVSASRPLHAPRIPELWLATVLLSTDQVDEASDLLLDGQRSSERRGLAWSLPYWHTVRAIERWMQEELDDAAAEAETALRVADRLDIVRYLELTRSVQAVIEIDRGNGAVARRLMAQAKLPHRPRAYDMWTAAALVRLGSDGAGDVHKWLDAHASVARLMSLPPKVWPSLVSLHTPFERVQNLLDEIGHISHDQRVIVSAVAAARSAGRQPSAPGPKAAGRAASGWDSLTVSELRVAGLVVTGHTNRAIAEQLHVSVHTVGTHLRHVFTKLDINTRVELTRLALQHGVTSEEA